MGEKIKIDYANNKSFTFDDQNAVGATTSTTLRTLETIAAQTYYVKKFGTDYAIGDITNAVVSTPRSDGGGVNKWRYDFYGWNGSAWVLMGSTQDAGGASGPYVDGSAFAASKIKIEITVISGVVTITDGDTIALTTDVDAPLTVNLSGEGNEYTFNAAWGTLTLYLSESGSTYYDENYKYGGKRHTPVVGSQKYPFFHPKDCFADGGWGANDGITIMDSEHYQIKETTITDAGIVVQSALGQTPTFVSPIGVSVYRDVLVDGNNDDTAYIAVTGSDVTGDGTYQKPYATHAHAITNRGTRISFNAMDSGEYDETIVLTGAWYLEPIYGQTPSFKELGGAVATFITVSSATVYISGYNFIGQGVVQNGIAANVPYNGTLGNCYFENLTQFGFWHTSPNVSNGETSYCDYNNASLVFQVEDTSTSTITNNIVRNFSGTSPAGATFRIRGGTWTGSIKNNLVYDCTTKYGFHLRESFGANFNITFENNVAYNCNYGIVAAKQGGGSMTIQNNITWDNVTADLYKTNNAATATYTNYGTNSGFTIGVGCITTDPDFISEPNDQFGINPESGAYHTGLNSHSMGIVQAPFNITANDVKFNGIIFDGLSEFIHAFVVSSTTNYTGLSVKWCDVKNYNGISIDLYDDNTDTDAIITNTYFFTNGQDVSLAYGGNTIHENIFSQAVRSGLWTNQTGNDIDHCVFYLSEYGIYNASSVPVIKNSIFRKQSLFGVYSVTSISITYCCVPSGVSSNVDASDSSNFIDNPLFVDESGQDFHIKTTERGYSKNSPCKEAASDGKDVGAFDVDYDQESDDWKTFTIEHNPRNMDDLFNPKGVSDFESATGERDSWAKSHRVILPMEWSSDSATSETQYKTLRSFSYRIKSRLNNLTDDECKFRIYLLPSARYGSGTGTIDATAKTLTDSTKSWIDYTRNEWWVAVVYETQSGCTVDASAKTVTKAGAGWTVDEWEDYYVIQNNNYFFVKSNTATVLTLSDTNDYLVNEASFGLYIVKLFHIDNNVGNVLTLTDSNCDLQDGNFQYWIHFILTKNVPNGFQGNQQVFDFEKWETKSSYSWTTESVKE